jgi:hypothetical protein
MVGPFPAMTLFKILSAYPNPLPLKFLYWRRVRTDNFSQRHPALGLRLAGTHRSLGLRRHRLLQIGACACGRSRLSCRTRIADYSKLIAMSPCFEGW